MPQAAAAPPDAAGTAAVREAARSGDFDRYLGALLAPVARRDGLLALAAFSGEVARMPLIVKEPMMGEIRLQWWREVIGEPDPSGRIGNPIADALRDAIARHDLDRARLLGVLEARSIDLYPDPMPDEASFRGYLAKTEGTSFALAARVLGADASPALDQFCELAGFALGATRTLVALPHMASRGRMTLPMTRIDAAGARLDDLMSGTATPAIHRLIDAIVADIRSGLAEVRALSAGLSRDARTALLPLALIEPHLRVFGREGFDPLRQIADVGPLSRIGRIWWAHATGRI